jgi:hypothetical protein
VAVQEVRWDKCSSQPTNNYTIFYGNGSANHHLGTGFITHKGIKLAFKRIELISDRTLYITPRSWCDISILHVHTLTEDKSDDKKDSFVRN